ncbi:hypothetical protein BCR39DRAFT_524226 [Naematelia encephala]|uniref:NADH dehydrogenase [ubiquinone] 1 alpha subcomplex subunit n=1 Tax=Naematelia encephala TaxID=71784 RepID=A0A1Y2BBJ3_9TREE|nr:hypothetical protein BCR39DRAFT_524226 [Naematelia encephala]
MSWFSDKMARLTPFFVRGKRYIGRDLEGNKFYELPSKTDARPKRVVEYRRMSEMSDYTSGKHRLPVQWSTWLSHTRSDPPTLSELETDASRLQSLQPLVAAIAERERAERIRQGYLIEPDDASSSKPPRLPPSRETVQRTIKVLEPSFAPPPPSIPPSLSIPSPSPSPSPFSPQFSSSSPPPPSPFPQSRSSQTDESAQPTPSSRLGPVRESEQQSYPIPTPSRPDLAPPGKPVDPSAYSSREELRRLSEEDTKRRMAQSGVDTQSAASDPAQVGNAKEPGSSPSTSSGLQPRRRPRK